MRAAIYHFTDKSQKRPCIHKKQISSLKEFAASLGYTDTDIYCDMSLKKSNQDEFNKFLSCCEDYDALITKDFYHIHDNTLECMNIMRRLREKGVSIYTEENGSFDFDDEILVKEEPLKIATYYSNSGDEYHKKEIAIVKSDILKLYADKKTSWSVMDQYIDDNPHQTDSTCLNLKRMIENRDKYDLILVDCFKDISRRTSKFIKIREELGLDIYSLQEGLLKHRKGEDL